MALKMALKIEEFDFSFTDSQVADLKERIDKIRLPNQAISPLLDRWDYGTNLPWLKDMVDIWRNGFDSQAFQEDLKKWPHYHTTIENLDIHFIHVESQSPTATPILLVHGWPGSFYEFKYVIDELANPENSEDQAFHVVVPSLPGYTFSQPPRERGWTMKDNARIFEKLMVGLGYSEYTSQGGDWGHQPCWPLVLAWSDHDDPSPTLFDKRGRDDQHLSYDILVNVSLYWFTESILTSFLPYIENRDWRYQEFVMSNMTSVTDSDCYISVPMGVSSFKFELAGSTKGMVAKSGNLKFYKEHSKGGHFAALNRPETLLGYIREFY